MLRRQRGGYVIARRDGLDAARVLMPTPQAENIREIDVAEPSARCKITMRGKPLPDNPKTSALTVLSALRFLQNRGAAVTI